MFSSGLWVVRCDAKTSALYCAGSDCVSDTANSESAGQDRRPAEAWPGQNVWTSGLGGVFPKDILIGKIVDSHSEDFGMSTVARVKLAANLSALEEVWVIMEP